jgi:hypothetical protein
MPANYAAFGLDGKVAIVTGASQGIGRAIRAPSPTRADRCQTG